MRRASLCLNAVTMTVLALTACAPIDGHGQRPLTVDSVLSGFVSSIVDDNPATPRGGLVPGVLAYPKSIAPMLVNGVLGGLEDLALSDPRPEVRFVAVGMFAAAGQTGPLGTGLMRKDIVSRLRSVYLTTSDRRVRAAILSRMADQAAEQESLEFLTAVGRAPDPNDLGHEPLWRAALNALAARGEHGRAALRRIAADSTQVPPEVREHVRFLMRGGHGLPQR